MRYGLRSFFEYIDPLWGGLCMQFPLTKALSNRIESLDHFIHYRSLVLVIMDHLVNERFHKSKILIALDVIK